MLRSAMRFARLMEVPELQALIPFVRTSYAQPSCYAWPVTGKERSGKCGCMKGGLTG